MRTLLRFGWAAAIGLALGSPAVAQTNGTGTDTGTGGTGTGGTGTGGGGNAGLGQQIELQTPSALDQTIGSQIGASSLNQSNILSRYYVNPQYQGRAGAQTGETPGGFGQPLYSNVSGGTGGRTGTTGFGGTTGGRTGTTGFGGTTGGRTGTTGFGGTTTGFGGTGGRTGLGGTTGFGGGGGGGRTGFGGTTGIGGIGGGRAGLGGAGGFGATNTAQIVPLSRQISYTATLQIPRQPAAAVAPRMQADIRGMLDRSTAIANPAGVQVQTNGAVVVLRGNARDADEARLIEGMIRLTPGVRDVRNELQFPNQQP